MGQTSSASTFDPFKAWRGVRDTGMDSWAKIAIQITSSPGYSLVSSLLAKPSLIATGVIRKEVEKTMALLLAHANMPSRSEVLALSTRLTHIEVVLDDLAAAVEALRAQTARPALAKRAASADRNHHDVAVPKEG
jgi:hypothetical protein